MDRRIEWQQHYHHTGMYETAGEDNSALLLDFSIPAIFTLVHLVLKFSFGIDYPQPWRDRR